MASYPTFTIEERLDAGWELCKRGVGVVQTASNPLCPSEFWLVHSFLFRRFFCFLLPRFMRLHVTCRPNRSVEGDHGSAIFSRHFTGIGARYSYGYS